jgi:hypothetical protein
MEERNAREVQLAPPGAGLPFIELTVSRILFGLARRTLSRESALKQFRAEADRMLALAEKLDPVRAQKQVLIKRVRGIEDSSRNWSVLMALDHLVIVNGGIIATIEQLAAERPLTRKVSTADVKPPPAQTMATIEKFRDAVQQYQVRIDRLARLDSKTCHVHPWFGPLNAHGWHCLAAIHHGIHRKQIEAILQAEAGR